MMKSKNIEGIRGLSDSRHDNKQRKAYIIIFIILIVFLSGFVLRFAWKRHQKAVATEAVVLAQSIESLIYPEHIAELSTLAENVGKAEYIMTKGSLVRLVNTSNLISNVYLMTEKNNQIIMMVDSSLGDSPEGSPSEQAYEKAAEMYKEDFFSERTLETNPISDSLGTWVSVLVPVRDPVNDKIIAVLGIDYDRSQKYLDLWKRMIPDMLIVLILLLLLLALMNSRRLSRRVAIDEALYQSVFNQAPTGIAIVEDKKFTSHTRLNYKNINPMFEDILGRSSRDLENVEWMNITHPEDFKADLEKFQQFKNGEIDGYSMEKRFIRPDESIVWTNMKIAPLMEGVDRHHMHLCLLEDISMRKQANEALKESERGKSVLLSHLPGMAYRSNYDKEWTMQFVSDGCFKLTGYTPEELVLNKRLSYNDIILPEYREPIRQTWDDVLAKRRTFEFEYELLTKKGERKWVLEIGEGVYNKQGDVESLEGIIFDISDRKKMEEGLRYNVDHDMWTGLHNRLYLEKTLRKDAKRDFIEKRALVAMDLGTLSSLSMAYGFQYSQNLIKEVAKVLKRLSTDRHQLFNTYANKFVFYIRDYADKEELLDFSKSLIKKLEGLLSVERINIGIGILEIEESKRKDVKELFKNILIATEEAVKTTETDAGICFFDKEIEDRFMRKEIIKHQLEELARGRNSDRLFLEFQPILDLDSNSIYEFEALARIKTHDLGLISPMEFIPLAEETKLIIPLGKKIIRQAFDFLNDLDQKGMNDVGISINISGIQLLRKKFAEELFEIIDKKQVNPRNIILEITESVFTSSYNEMCNIIEELRASGLKIAIDDFGTEYSSFARVRELNIDCLKIDKYFIDKLLLLKPEEAITGDIISMAHKLGHYVIAEGVEYKEQVQYLREHGCDKIQGYLISKPLSKEAAIELLQKGTNIQG